MEHFKTKIIEFFGLPKTGKTTTVDALVKYLKLDALNVTVVKERASLSPIVDKLHPSFNYWTTVSFIKEYIEANEKGYDFLIADRGILDSYIWINLLSKRIDDESYFENFKKLFDQDFIVNNYLLSFHYKADFDIIMSREDERLMKKSPGRIMNNEILQLYSSTYKNLKPQLEKISDIIELDSTIKNIPQILQEVSRHIDALKID